MPSLFARGILHVFFRHHTFLGYLWISAVSFFDGDYATSLGWFIERLNDPSIVGDFVFDYLIIIFNRKRIGFSTSRDVA
jgi:hypothetical protein